MIDALAAMVLVSSVLFPLLFFQMNQVKESHEMLYQTIASKQLENLSEALDKQWSGNQLTSLLVAWNQNNKRLLPQGVGRLVVTSQHQCQLIISWFYIKQRHQMRMTNC